MRVEGLEHPRLSAAEPKSAVSAIPPYAHVWSQQQDSDPRPAVYKTAALPTELCWLKVLHFTSKLHHIVSMEVAQAVTTWKNRRI